MTLWSSVRRYVCLLWATGIRKAPKLKPGALKVLLPIGFAHALGHAGAVIALGAGAVSRAMSTRYSGVATRSLKAGHIRPRDTHGLAAHVWTVRFVRRVYSAQCTDCTLYSVRNVLCTNVCSAWSRTCAALSVGKRCLGFRMWEL